MDVIVTATSGAGKRVLDIMQVKPGCVITDVARPLDLSAEDVAKRPDVLVVESGEIRLPGDVRMRNIGLPEGWRTPAWPRPSCWPWRAGSRTSRWAATSNGPRSREIYRLGLKHGMQLATISGVNGVFSDDDIAEIRERALAARG